ncbi:MAG TPA: ABC transporter permease [Methylomirabilota bacterium]|nr:ABC transporter permease [Methylomirabilota bacterium]HEV8615245.1 ABC transporter permease [Methylomirabilota bacterium]
MIRPPSRYTVISWATVAALVLAWEAVTALGLVTPFVLPSPAALVRELGTLAARGYAQKPLSEHVLASLARTLVGLGAGLAVGIPLGLWMGMSRVVSAVLSPVFAFLRPIPPIAFIPLMILYFGIGEFSKVVLIFMAALYYVVLNTAAGVAAVPADLISAGRNLGLTRVQLFRHVILPAALPHVLTGARTATAVSWAIVVAAELIAAQAGLGFMVMDAATFFRVPDVYAGIVIIGLIGLTLEVATRALERSLLHWQGR